MAIVRDFEETAGVEEPVKSKERVFTRSGLTKWIAQRQAAQRAGETGPSYDRCQTVTCWGRATWECPSCRSKTCIPHRAPHSCGALMPSGAKSAHCKEEEAHSPFTV